MHIAILGAGAMGSLFGGLLAEAGHRVTRSKTLVHLVRLIDTKESQ
jgi:ketopantoate reductase